MTREQRHGEGTRAAPAVFFRPTAEGRSVARVTVEIGADAQQSQIGWSAGEPVELGAHAGAAV